MSRGTRRSAAAATEIDDEPEPSSPAQPTVSVAGFKEEFSKFTFLQSVIQKGVMLEDEAKDMYMQLTDSDDGALRVKYLILLRPYTLSTEPVCCRCWLSRFHSKH